MTQKYRDFVVALQAGIPKSIAVQGDYWQVFEASGKVSLQFDDGPAIKRPQGTGGPVDPRYDRVTVTSSTDQTVTLGLGIVGTKPPYDARATFAGTVSVSTDLPTTLTPLTDVAIAAGAQQLLAGADATRTALNIRMPDDAAGDVRLGDSTVAAAKGIRIGAGDAASVPGGAAVYAYNTSASAITVTLMAEGSP